MKENKLIAEFMNNEYRDYSTWNGLMPVVQKIGDDYYNTPLDETLSNLTEVYENIWTLQDLHGAVVEFIKELNEES
tara:strand:+ start:102 stop:329 length:228 start_codon:yes stop_codon:yes gene_type:complete